jgi:hypothetical protein
MGGTSVKRKKHHILGEKGVSSPREVMRAG